MIMDISEIRKGAEEMARAIGKSYLILPEEERSAMLLSRVQEAAAKKDPHGTWEVYHILRIPILSDNDIMKAFDAIRESHPLEIDSFIRDDFPSEKVVRKGLEIFAKQGRLFLVFDLCNQIFGPKSDSTKKPIINAVNALAYGSVPNGEDPMQVLNKFLFTAARHLGDDTQMDIIKLLARHNMPQPLVNMAEGKLYSLAVREVAKGVIASMRINIGDITFSSADMGIKVVGGSVGKVYGKRRRMLN